MSLHDVRIGRNMMFLKRGMQVDMNGKKGTITGEGMGMCIRIKWEGQKQSVTIHPTWQTTYYGKDNQIIKDYKQP